MKKVLFTATVDSHILAFHIPFLKYFKENGYEVHVATNGNEDIPYCDKKIVIPFERRPFKLSNIKAIFNLRKVLEKEQYNIIHTHTPMGSVVTRLAAKKVRNDGTRVIYTAHGFHFFKGSSKLSWLLFYPVEKYLSKFTDTLITINKEDYNLAKDKFKKCYDIRYVPGVGIDNKKFDINMTLEEKTNLRNSLGLKKDDFVMIYPAELNKNKNQILLLDVMKELNKTHKNIHLLLPGIDSYNGFYQNYVLENDIKNVHFLGFRTDIPNLLKISNLAVASSLREGLPVNIMEAMFVGLPVVASNCRGNRDLVEHNRNGYLIDLNDEEAYRTSIYKIYKNRNKENKFGIESKKIIKSYMLDEIMDTMKKIYQKHTIIYLRTTSIFNDSRATKEIDAYLKLGYNVVALGWDRQGIVTNDKNQDNIRYEMFKKKAEYGKGYLNIINLLLFQIWAYSYLKKHRYEYKIIHSCDFDTGFISSKIAKKYNKKIIYDVYDYYSAAHSLGKLTKIVEKAEIKVINNADYTLICTEQRKEQIFPANPKKLVVIHNSPNLDIKDNSIKIIKSNSNKIKVVYVGILQDDRLLLEVCEEFSKNPKYELHIGGFGKYENDIKKYAENNENIYFYGSLKYNEVLSLQKDCDVLFATYNPKIPNHKYCAPNKVYEAMALNKPIIVCKNTGIDKLILKEKIGYAIDYNADSFIKCLNGINLQNKITSRNLYEEKYSWSIMESKIKEIIHDLEL